MAEEYADLVVGVVGTGLMGTAHAHAWSSKGIKVIIGSRDPDKGKRLAQRIGQGCEGGGLPEMCAAANMIFLCIPPGKPAADFIQQHRDVLKGKMFVDMLASYTRYYSAAQRAPPPHFSSLTWLKELLGDETSSWVKGWANFMHTSIKNFKAQPAEVAGDPAAKAMAMRLLTTAGFEPLDCGTAADAQKIEPGYHERRWKHPRHLEFNGANHP